MMRWPGWLCGLVLLLSASTAASEEPWYNLYEAGLRSMGTQDWAAAEKALARAAGANAARGRRARTYGTRYILYIPDYQLGVVHFNQGRYSAALEDFARAEKLGQVSAGDPEWRVLSELSQGARARLEARAAGPPSVPAGEASPAVAPGPRGPDPLLVYARTLFEEGRLEESRRAARSLLDREPGHRAASELLEAIGRKEAELRQGAAERQRAPVTAAAQPPSSASPGPAAAAAGPSAPAGRDSGDPAAERAALVAFFEGDYERARRLLEAVPAKRGRSARTLFYLACSNASLALLQGKHGEPQLALAREQFRAARNLDPGVSAGARWVSPAVLEALAPGGGS